MRQPLLHPILLGRPVNDLNPQRPAACKSSLPCRRKAGSGSSSLRGRGRRIAASAGPGQAHGCPIGNFRPVSVMLDLAAFTRLRILETGRYSVEEVAREWRNGRRAGFRCQYPKGCGGSNPPSRTQTRRAPVLGQGLFCFNAANPGLFAGPGLEGSDTRTSLGFGRCPVARQVRGALKP